MPDYKLTHNQLEIVSGSIYLYPSASNTSPNTAISASTPQILAVTCSSNLNSRLVPSNNTSSFSIISFSTGSNQQRLILRYLSGSYNNNGKIKSVTPTKYLKKTTGARDRYVDIPLLNNDDSLTVAYKTVNALSKTGGFNSYFSASLETIGIDDPTTTGVGSIEVGNNFIVGSYPGGTGLNNFSSSLGINQSIGSTFRIRAGEGIGDVTIGKSFVIDNYETFGTFKIFNYLSGSVGKANFSGSMVQVGGMKIGSSFKIGGSTQLFSHNIIQEGLGIQNQPFYPGDYNINSSSLGILIDPEDNISAMLTGSNQSASLYFSASGRIGVGTTNPQTDVDIAADKFQVRARRDSKGIFINEEGNIESFNRTTEGAATGSEFIMSYSRGGSSAITSQLIALLLFGGSNPGLGGRDNEIDPQAEADRTILEEGGDLAGFIARADPELIRKLTETGEELGILGTGAQTGDVLGSIRWMADSGSFDQKYFDNRGSGEMLKIQGRVSEATEAGVKGDMLFLTTTNVANPPIEVMRIGSDGNVHITGSLNVTGDLTYEDTLVIHVTASGDLSASGTITGNSIIGTIGTATQGTIDHDSLANFVANEHIDHSGVSVIAGDGLTGGGTIAANRTLTVVGGTGVTANANDIAIGQDVATDANVTFGTVSTTNLTNEINGNSILNIHSSNNSGNRVVGLNLSASGHGHEFSLALSRGTRTEEGSFVIAPSGVATSAANAVFTLSTEGNITSSGNISSSGIVTANSFAVQNKTVMGSSDGTTLQLDGGGLFSSLQYGRNGTTPSHIFNGNITASGDISASAAITSNTFIGTSLDISGDADIDGTMEADAITLGGATVLAAIDEDAMGSNSATTVPTQQSVKAYVDARKSVLRNQTIYVNDSPFIQNSLYFGHSTANQPFNWNDPQAIGGDPMTVSSFTISDDDQKWGMIIPYNISKIEILCGLRPGGSHTDQFSLVLYTASRITGNVTAITLTRVAQNGVNFDGSGRYTNNDLTHTADIDAGTMIYVGVGTNTSSPVAKNAPGYMSITITQR